MAKKKGSDSKKGKRFPWFTILMLAGAVAGSWKLLHTMAVDFHGGEALHHFKDYTAATWHAAVSFTKKVQIISQSDWEVRKLRLENANLRRWAETLRFNCEAETAGRKSAANASALYRKTGSRTGRVLAAIKYSPPLHLLPHQLYTLGVSYMKGKDYEKAAVIFTFLTGLEEDDSFKTAKNWLLTGLSWYKLRNYTLADQYFTKAIRTPKIKSNLRYQAQAKLWKAVLADRFNQNKKTQYWLEALVDQHPHAEESAWVNRPGGKRAPASK